MFLETINQSSKYDIPTGHPLYVQIFLLTTPYTT